MFHCLYFCFMFLWLFRLFYGSFSMKSVFFVLLLVYLPCCSFSIL